MVNQGREVGSHRGEVSAIGQPCVRQKQKLIWGTRGVTRAKCWGQLWSVWSLEEILSSHSQPKQQSREHSRTGWHLTVLYPPTACWADV